MNRHLVTASGQLVHGHIVEVVGTYAQGENIAFLEITTLPGIDPVVHQVLELLEREPLLGLDSLRSKGSHQEKRNTANSRGVQRRGNDSDHTLDRAMIVKPQTPRRI